MGLLVHREVGAVPITLAAHVALKRFLPRMDQLVADEMGTLREGFLTLGAPVQLDPGVCVFVAHQVRPLREALGAGSAPERSLPRVYPLVPDQVGTQSKPLPAIEAVKESEGDGTRTAVAEMTMLVTPGTAPPGGFLPLEPGFPVPVLDTPAV